MATSIAVVGSAGMGADQGRLTHAAYDRMVMMASAAVRRGGFRSVLAGGAPWASHVGVGLVANRVIAASALTLVPAAPFADGGFNGTDRASEIHRRGHEQFRAVTGLDSLGEIDDAIDAGATLATAKDLAERDAALAEADVLLAFTFGGAKPWAVAVATDPRAAVDVAGRASRRIWSLARDSIRVHITLGC